jgi:hypothetical protein
MLATQSTSYQRDLLLLTLQLRNAPEDGPDCTALRDMKTGPEACLARERTHWKKWMEATKNRR